MCILRMLLVSVGDRVLSLSLVNQMEDDMWPLLGGLVSGIGSFFGQQQTNQANIQATQMTNQANEQMQQQNQQWEQQMSNTAYQRADSDMKAAGLNPMMMFGSGGPAGTPSVQPARNIAPQIQQSPLSTVAGSIKDTVNSALTASMMDKMVQEVSNMKVEQANTAARTALVQGPQYRLTDAEATHQYELARLVNAQIPTAENAAVTARNQMGIDPTVRKAADVTSFGAKVAGDVTGAVGGALGGALRAVMGRKNSAVQTHTDPYGNVSTTESSGTSSGF